MWAIRDKLNKKYSQRNDARKLRRQGKLQGYHNHCLPKAPPAKRLLHLRLCLAIARFFTCFLIFCFRFSRLASLTAALCAFLAALSASLSQCGCSFRRTCVTESVPLLPASDPLSLLVALLPLRHVSTGHDLELSDPCATPGRTTNPPRVTAGCAALTFLRAGYIFGMF
jgi:hypothetical protein